MEQKIWLNIILNTFLVIVFVIVSNEVLKAGLEETLVTVVMIYGVVSVGVNAILARKNYNNPR